MSQLKETGHQMADEKYEYLKQQSLTTKQFIKLLKAAADAWEREGDNVGNEDQAIVLYSAANHARARAQGHGQSYA